MEEMAHDPAQEKMVHDPAHGAFPGGFPTPLPDVPVTIVFLLLFALGAFTHISIYRANAKRGHKFLLSDLMFDFCVIRTLTCTFRIVWSYVSLRPVILVALIFENGGAAVIFAVNLFFAQRIFRAMHPKIGWHPVFNIFSLFLIWSVPAVIVLNITVLSVSLYSVGNEAQLMAAEKALTVGAGWNIMLSVMPLIILLISGGLTAKYEKAAERFGDGNITTKAALLAYASATLAVGAALRAAAIANPAPADTGSVLFGKALFYTTGFLLEILVVALYAVARIDLLFHIPNGSSQPGHYSAAHRVRPKKGLAAMEHDIEETLGLLGIRYETIIAPISSDDHEFVFAKLGITRHGDPWPLETIEEEKRDNTFNMPPRSERVSRRLSLIESLKSSKKGTSQGPHTPEALTFYME